MTLLKQMEQNALAAARHGEHILGILDAFTRYVNKAMEFETRDEAMRAINDLRRCLYQDNQKKVARCLMFVPSPEIEALGREMFERHFGEDGRCIAHFMSEYGTLPREWSSKDEKEARAEGKKRLTK